MKQIVANVPFDSLRSGDTVQAGYSQVGTVNVEREVPDPPKPKHAPGTTGTAIVHGVRTHGMIDEDGDFNFLEYDSFESEVLREYTVTRDFVPDSDEKTEPAVPQITREQFFETLSKVVDDNGLAVDSGPLATLIVFAADRLGLN
jgi:hypothetical protein